MLKSLDVSCNSIQEIPEEIGSAASLVKYVHLLLSRVIAVNALYVLMFKDFRTKNKSRKLENNFSLVFWDNHLGKWCERTGQ